MWWALLLVGAALLRYLWRWRRSGQPLFDYFELTGMYSFARLCHRCTWDTQVTLPEKGPALLVANHQSNADPLFLMAASPRPLHFLQARECYEVWPLRYFFRRAGCIPVTRDGRDVAGVRRALRDLRRGSVLCIFPEGEIGWTANGALKPVHFGAALLALRSRVPVIPARIVGGPHTPNMLRAWFVPCGGVRVRFGTPIDLSPYYERRIDRALLREVTDLFVQRMVDLQPEQRPSRRRAA